MNEHEHIPYLREAVIFLIAAGVIVPLVHRLRVSPVLGYLVVGALIGPFGLGLFAEDIGVLRHAVIEDVEGVQRIASLGVVFLLFMIGLELSFERLWSMRRLVFGLGSAQVGVTTVVIALIAWSFGNLPTVALLFGAAFALSSTAMVMQLLGERRRVATTLGRTSFSILLMQDLAVVPLLFLLGVLGTSAQQGLGAGLAVALLEAAVAVAVIVLVGRSVLRPLFRLVSSARSPELFVAVTLLTVIGTAVATGAAGLSMALGAFLAGLLLAETEYRHEIEVDIEPFKGLLLGLFFMSVGMGVDLRVVGDAPGWIAVSVVGLFLVKAVIIAVLATAFGLPRPVAIEAGLLLGQGGEFVFVVVGLAMTLGVVPADAGQFMLIVASMSMLVTPLVAVLAARAGRAVRPAADHAPAGPETIPDQGLEGHVLIAGFGRVGQALARVFDGETLPYLALDLDSSSVAAHRSRGLPVYFGDASRPDILRRAGIEHARALVVTMDSPEAARRTVEAARRAWPWLPIFARARDVAHASVLAASGATRVVPETVESSLQLAARVLEGLGVPDEAVDQAVEVQRALELGVITRRPSPGREAGSPP